MKRLKQIHPRIQVGSADTCKIGDPNTFVVHMDEKCYLQALSRTITTVLPLGFIKTPTDLFIAISDVLDKDYFMMAHLKVPLQYIHQYMMTGKNILIHCGAGLSRSASIGFLYLVKYLKNIPNTSFEEAQKEYWKVHDAYEPSPGIKQFIIKHWNEIVEADW